MTDDHDLAAELTAYIDGELSAEDAKKIAAALDADPKLRALEQQLRSTVVAMKSLHDPQPSMALRRLVLASIDEVPASLFDRLRAAFTLPRLVPVAGLAAAAIAVAVVAGRDSQPTDDPEQLVVAQNLEVLEDLEVVGLDEADDLDVVQNLHELEATP